MYGWYAYDPRMRVERRHPPSPRPAARQLARRARARARPAVLAAGQPVPVLRRRDRHGRQHLAARPRRVPHADAVDARSQRRVLDRRPRQALPAGRAVARLQLPRTSTSSRSSRSRGRCCTGCATSSTCARRTRPSGSATIRVLQTDHESVLAFVREYEGIGHPVRRPARSACCACSASRTTRSSVDDRGRRARRAAAVRPVRRRRVPDGRRRRLG